MINHQTIQLSNQAHDADRGICKAYNCSSLANFSIFTGMSEVEILVYRRRRTLLVTIPTVFADVIPITQKNVVKMVLNNKGITMEKI